MHFVPVEKSLNNFTKGFGFHGLNILRCSQARQIKDAGPQAHCDAGGWDLSGSSGKLGHQEMCSLMEPVETAQPIHPLASMAGHCSL